MIQEIIKITNDIIDQAGQINENKSIQELSTLVSDLAFDIEKYKRSIKKNKISHDTLHFYNEDPVFNMAVNSYRVDTPIDEWFMQGLKRPFLYDAVLPRSIETQPESLDTFVSVKKHNSIFEFNVRTIESLSNSAFLDIPIVYEQLFSDLLDHSLHNSTEDYDAIVNREHKCGEERVKGNKYTNNSYEGFITKYRRRPNENDYLQFKCNFYNINYFGKCKLGIEPIFVSPANNTRSLSEF